MAWLNFIISAVQGESIEWYSFNSCIILKTYVFRKMCMCICLLHKSQYMYIYESESK